MAAYSAFRRALACLLPSSSASHGNPLLPCPDDRPPFGFVTPHIARSISLAVRRACMLACELKVEGLRHFVLLGRPTGCSLGGPAVTTLVIVILLR